MYWLLYFSLVGGVLQGTHLGEFESYEHCQVALSDYEYDHKPYQGMICLANSAPEIDGSIKSERYDKF